MCIQTVLTACLYVRTCLCMCTHAGIQTGHTCLRGCITHENAAPETCTYMHVSKSDLSLKIEEDVDGAIEMMAQTGPFSVPIRCRRKRCTVSGYLNVHTYVYARGARFNRLQRLIDCLPRIDSQSRGELSYRLIAY